MKLNAELKRRIHSLVWGCALPWCATLAAADQFQVNEFTTNSQRNPVVAADADGDFVAVWFNPGVNPDHETNYAIAGRLYSVDGDPGTLEMRLDADGPCLGYFLKCFRRDLSLAVATSGSFVAVWTQDDDSQYKQPSLRGRSFSDTGFPLGGEFVISSGTTLVGAVTPFVATDGQDGFVAVWSTIERGAPVKSTIEGRLFSSSGVPGGPVFLVSGDTTSDHRLPAVAMRSSGEFVVAWHATGSLGSDDSAMSVQARRFDASANPQGPPFQVNSYTTGMQSRPAIGMDGDGGFVVVWESWGSNGSDKELSSIQEQLFDSAGDPSGPQFQVNQLGSGFQEHPAVAVQPNGEFAVAWISGDNLQARLFDAFGNPRGPEFRVEGSGFPERIRPSIAAQPAGEFVVAWTSYEGVGNDDSNETIQARRITSDWLFLDSFETEDVSRWSGAVL